MFAVQTKKTC